MRKLPRWRYRKATASRVLLTVKSKQLEETEALGGVMVTLTAAPCWVRAALAPSEVADGNGSCRATEMEAD